MTDQQARAHYLRLLATRRALLKSMNNIIKSRQRIEAEIKKLES